MKVPDDAADLDLDRTDRRTDRQTERKQESKSIEGWSSQTPARLQVLDTQVLTQAGRAFQV